MEDWNDYALILALHRTGTLRGAAISMATTHTTVARKLDLLHKRKQAVVFEKTASGYRVTPYGQQLVEVARKLEQILLTSERLYSASDKELAGSITLSIGEPMSQYLLLHELVAFSRQYPNIQLTINSTSRTANLDNSEADVAIRTVKHLPEHLVGRRLFPFSLGYYGHRDYLSQVDRAEWRWIAPSESEFWPEWLEQSPYPELPIGIIFDDIVSRYKAIEAGLGLGRTACFLGDSNPNLERLPGTQPIVKNDIWVLTHPNLRHTPRVKLLMQYLVDALNNKRDLIEGKSW